MRDSQLKPLCQILAGHSEQVDWASLSPATWDRLAASAQVHGVAPLLYYTLHTTGWLPQIPPHVQQTLRSEYYRTTARNTIIYQELTRILNVLQQQQIPVVVLKGAALAATVYPEIGLRPMVDLDVLVPRKDIARSVEVMKEIGYCHSFAELRPGYNVQYMHHISLRKISSPDIILEIHHSLITSEVDWVAPPLDWFWKETRQWSQSSHEQPPPGDTKMVQFSPVAHILYLAAHLTIQHELERSPLIWLYDLHLLLTCCTDDISYDEMISRAIELRWSSVVSMALERTVRCFDSQIPQGILTRLQEAQDAGIEQIIQQKTNPLTTRTSHNLHKLARMNWRERIGLALVIIFPTPSYIQERYQPDPLWMWPLCYPYRWLDMAKDVVGTLFKLAQSRVRKTRK
jgi:hypothetical protein